ncbi:MAG TPA: O-antigen ligase family protein [Alphaproteobacteria bacterium]|nr:O-antigen ligase family protein [Alphaproteobacteria bacterium]
MNRSAPGATPLAVALLGVAFALAGPIMALAPLGMAPLLFAATVFTIIVERLQSRTLPAPPRRALMLSILFLGWCAVTLFWALDRSSGARKLVDMVAIFVSTLALCGLARRFDFRQRQALAKALAIGAIVGLILLGIETAFGFPLYRLVMGDDNPKLKDLLLSKRSVDAVPLLVWPAALAFERLGRAWLGVILALAFTAASFKLTAASSTLAMILSLLVLAIAWWRVSAARKLLAIGIAAAFLLILPGAILVYDHFGKGQALLGEFDSSHQYSGGHRLEIWHFAAVNTLDRPITGHGINSSRFIPNNGAVSAFQPPGKPVITLHPHDAFLQAWLELGAVGVVLIAALLLAALRETRGWAEGANRFVLAGGAAALVIAGLAFGIWQTWWMATLAFDAVVFASLAGQSRHG